MSGTRLLPLLAALPAFLLVLQVHFTCGVVYSLDDPYIHLALARQILHGHYGVNPGEFSAPSSSILWPFLLAPFAFTRLVEFLPLAINLAALLVTLWWIERWLETFMAPLWALAATVAAALLLNLYGLPLSGMEHSLQVMMVVVVALSLVRQSAGRQPLGWPFWCSIVLLPLVRYEGLAISLPVLAFLLKTPGRRAGAVAAGVLIALGVGGFSLFLYSHGGGLLPASVVAKGAGSILEGLPGTATILTNAAEQAFFVFIAAFGALILVREGRTLEALLLLVAPTLGHLAFGRFGWFGRYQIYFNVWVGILFLDAYVRAGLARWRALDLLLAAGFAWGSVEQVRATLLTPASARNIADQQKQMAIVARDYLDEPVAVNDLGFVSWYARHYVLDLYGLGSYEALRARTSAAPARELAQLMDRKRVEQAMVHDRVLTDRPAHWIRVATLTLPLPWVTVGDDRVSFYSANPEAAARLRQALAAYRKSSPQAAMMLELVPF